MELFNKSGVLVATVLVSVGVLIGAQAKEDMVPPAQVIEATAERMNTTSDFAAERRLREWAEQGSPVARRELAFQYESNRQRRDEAIRLLEQAAGAGDALATNRLAEIHRELHEAQLGDLKESSAARTASWTRY